MWKVKASKAFIWIMVLALLVPTVFIGGISEAATAPVNVWDKYDTKMVWTDGEWEYQGFSGGTGWGYSGYRITGSGQFELTGEWGVGDGYRYEFWSNGWLNRYRSGVEMVNGDWQSGHHWWYQRYAVQQKVRGNLIQSNLVGEYPDNGLHSDGYWYVKKTITNNIPTLSINSSGDKTLYNDGGSFIVSGTVQDSDNDSITVSAVIGGVKKSVVVTGTSTAKPWSLTWSGTELPVGVYRNPTISATDGKSPVTNAYNGKLTIVAQVYYYWSKFNVTAADGWTLINDGTVSPGINLYKKSIGWEYLDDFAGRSSENYGRISDLYKDSDGYVTGVNNANGRLSLSLLNTWNPPAKYSNNSYETYSPIRMEMTTRQYGYYTDVTYNMYALTTNPPQIKGSLIQANIKAVQGTYPDDGIHADGYWYVKAGLAPNNMPILTVNQSGNKTINLKTGSDTFTITGTVIDADNDTLLVSSTIGGVNKQVAVSNAGASKNWTLSWHTGEFNVAGDVTWIQVIVDDGRGGVATVSYTGKLTVDKTPLYYWDKYNVPTIDTPSKGALVQANIHDLDGTYPDNGLHTDGYWYVKKSTTNMSPVVVVNGTSIKVNKDNPILTLEGTVTDIDGDTVTISATVDGVTKTTQVTSPTSAKSWSIVWAESELAAGWYTGFTIAAQDGKGGSDSVLYTGAVIVDRVSPSTPVITLSETDWVPNDVTVSITAEDMDSGLAGIYYRLNGAAWVKYTGELDFVDDGETVIDSYAEDQAGNKSAESSATVRIVKNPPSAPTLKPSASGWTSGKVTVELTDTLSNVPFEYEYKINDGSYVKGSTVEATTEGDTKITGRAVNSFGMVSPESTIIVKLDNTKPEIEVTPDGRGWSSDSVDVSIDITDALSGVRPNSSYYKVTTSSTPPVDWELITSDVHQTVVIDQEGTYYVHVKTEDVAGNQALYTSGAFRVQHAPQKPLLRVTGVQNNVVSLEWSLPGGGSYTDGYNYELVNQTTGARYSASYPTNTYTDASVSGGRNYTYTVTVTNHVGSATSDEVVALTKPDAPSDLRLEKVGRDFSRAVLYISPVVGADNYRAIVTDVNGGVLEDRLMSSTEHTIQGMTAGALYSIKVSGVNASGEGDAYTTSFLTLPDVPGGFSAVQIRETDITLGWNTVTSATYYSLERFEEEIFNGDALVFTDVGLDSGTEYVYRISAGNDTGGGEYSDALNLITLPGRIAAFTVVDIGEDTVTLSWADVRGASAYRLLLDGLSETTASYGNAAVTFTGLSPGTRYEVEGGARNRSGDGAMLQISFVTLPVAPTGAYVTDVEETTATVVWDAVYGATKYKVVVDGTAYEVTDTSLAVAGLTGGKEYTYTVAAGNAAGYGESVSGTFMTKPQALSYLRVKALTPDTITVEWDVANTAIRYYGQLEGAGAETLTGSEYTVTGLQPGVGYNLIVWAENLSGEGKQTTIRVVTKTLSVDSESVTVDIDVDKAVIEFGEVENGKDYVVKDEDGNEVWRGTESPAVISPLTSGKDYDFTVIVENEQGEESEPTEIKFVAIPGVPGGIKDPAVTEDTVTFDLGDMLFTGGDTLIVERNGEEVATLRIPLNEADKVFVDKALNPGTDYEYTFKARNASGDSEPLVIKVKTKPKQVAPGGGGMPYTPSTNEEETRPEDKDEAVKSEAGDINDGSVNTGTAKESKFKDISDKSFAKEAIEALTEQGIIKGVTDSMFEPDREITRMEFAALLVRATDAETNNSLEITYKDINKSGWYMKELNAAIANEIAIGFNKTEFRPLMEINREQAAKMIGNIVIKKYNIDSASENKEFSDMGSVSEWAAPEVQLISSLNILSGYPDGSLRPKGRLTRAESAVLIFYMLQLQSNNS